MVKFDYDEFVKHFLNEILNRSKGRGFEIEVRIGTIQSTVTRNRMFLRTMHPVVFAELPPGVKFNTDVGEAWHSRVRREMAAAVTAETRDVVYVGSHCRKIVGEGKAVYERKLKRESIVVFMPRHKYDMKVSVAIEKQIGEPGAFRPSYVRERQRTSLQRERCVIDLTKVAAHRADSQGGSEEGRVEYEMEVEITDESITVDELYETAERLMRLK
ncbi:hypothetical protein ECANGB1_1304 [Enterospora canceri]|uniref:mRNA-capping enzyme subunit beta n=1 Tax=Enterospora canceri TaxID=1081671 RepID=A0A1Y1S693_9MICR|nr:hypothetical protein ECANGB1_1304 [Enterospora canceri]